MKPASIRALDTSRCCDAAGSFDIAAIITEAAPPRLVT
jgi:hypothetical protein